MCSRKENNASMLYSIREVGQARLSLGSESGVFLNGMEAIEGFHDMNLFIF